MKTLVHENSLQAYHSDDGAFGERAMQVMAKLRAMGRATDKQIAQALNFSHKAAVQPRISELVKAGRLEECGSERDPDTGKTVRIVRVKEPAPTQTQLSL